MTYLNRPLADLPSMPDGTLVLVTGTYSRNGAGATLRDAGEVIELSDEPFDWSPRHNTRLEVWGQLWNASVLRLIVHNARTPGDVRRQPRSFPTPRAGTTLTVTARVQRVGADLLAVTSNQQSYLLRGRKPPDGYHHLTGTLVRESPAVLHLTAHHDLSRAMLPPTEVPHD